MSIGITTQEITAPNVSMQRINDYVESGKKLILSQYRNSPNFNTYLAALLKQVQELENATYDVYMYTPLVNMYGAQLDRIGLSYGLLRNGMDDVNFKIRIITQIQINLSSGTPESVITAAKLLLNATKVKFGEVYPAGVSLYIEAKGFTSNMLNLIQNFLIAGVELKHLAFSLHDNPFTLAEIFYEEYKFEVNTQGADYDYVIDDTETNLTVIHGLVKNLPSKLTLSELVLNKSNLEVDDEGSLYMVDDENYLELVPFNANEDYTIVKFGGKLIETLQ
jgi:hypothetical protein